MRKLRKVALLALPLIALLLVGLIVVERYVFSLTGYILGATGLCTHKSVDAGGYNGLPEKLSFVPDVETIAEQMGRNDEYGTSLVGTLVVISKNFNGVKYKVMLQRDQYAGVPFGTFNINTYPFSATDNIGDYSLRNGEPCRTPNAVLEGNIYSIIDDLPLKSEEKDELKSHVHAGVIVDINLPIM